MVPGMGHCATGPGPNAFGNRFSGGVVTPPALSDDADHDAMLALQRWVEEGPGPDKLVAAKYASDTQALGVQMTRPICSYPKVPRYNGIGSTADAANFNCVPTAYDGAAYNPVPAAKYLK